MQTLSKSIMGEKKKKKKKKSIIDQHWFQPSTRPTPENK